MNDPKDHWGLVRTVLLLPGTVLVFVPAAILWMSLDSRSAAALISPHGIQFWLALLAAGMGLGLSVWTSTLFTKFGDGTPAPWDPPMKLVILGPYRHVRNPMITGVLLILFAEALVFRSWPVALWMIVFCVCNMIYFPLIEERGLEKRFGEDYRKYKAHVPRWIPRLQPWEPGKEEEPLGPKP